MHSIYVAQHPYLTSEIVNLKLAPAGMFVVKIGKTHDIADRALTINGKDKERDWRYLGIAGWKFVRFREVLPWRLHRSEKDSHNRFRRFRMKEHIRDQVSPRRDTGYELFLGDGDMIDQIHREFRHLPLRQPRLEAVHCYCDHDFRPTYQPYVEPVHRPPWEKVFYFKREQI
jgi:hypothetical protein